MALTSGWLLALLAANLMVGMAIGWVARTFVPGAAAPPEPGSTPEDSNALMAEISRKTCACTAEMKRYEQELEAVDDAGQTELIERIQKSGAEYEDTLNADVARFSDLTLHGDAVLRHVLIELIKHAGHVNRFTKTLSEQASAESTGDVRATLTLAITDLISSNRKLEGELHSARREIEKQRSRLAEVQREARIDSLTRIANRRFFTERHDSMHSRFERGNEVYAIAVLDLDHFKDLNDTYGHAAGDAALRVFARILEDCIRKYDLPARIGGEEFAVLLDAAGQSEAMIIAERIRSRTASVKVRFRGQEISFTTSIGVAVVRNGETTDSLMHRADAALYAAKNAGRDRVEFASDDGSPAPVEEPEMAPAF